MLLSLLPTVALAASGTCNDSDCKHEAEVTVKGNTTHYDTIGEALKAAGGENGPGGTVKLLKDGVTLVGKDSVRDGYGNYYNSTTIYKDVILDLNGKTLTCNTYVAISVQPNAHFEIKNGTFKNISNDSWACAIEAVKKTYTGPGCTITVAGDAVIEANNGISIVGHTTLNVYGKINATMNAIYGSGPKNKVFVEGATLTSENYGIYQQHKDGGSTYTIENSTITVGQTNKKSKALWICNEEDNINDTNQGWQTLEIENSTITGYTGIYVEYTNMTVSGDETQVNAPSDGYALAVLNRDTTGKTDGKTLGTLSITGGTFKGQIYIEPNEGAETATAKLTISGGTFDTTVKEEYLADNMMQDQEGNVIAIVPATGITLNNAKLQMYTGGTEKLTATVTPDSTTDTIVWSSGKEAVATVDQNGLVKAVAPGTAVITVSSQENPDVKATCTVTVTNAPVPVESISLDQGTLWLCWDWTNRTAQLTATVLPANATDKTVTWSSSAPAVATVDQNGSVTAVGPGTAVITVNAGEHEDTCTVYVSTYPPADPSYQITIPATANGTVTVSPTSAKEDQVVTITVTPNSGYELASLTVTDRSGNRVTVTANPDGTYRFVMPASQVTVSVAFVPVELPFTDVTEANWYYDEVYYVWANGLMQGTSATTFGPNVDTTRAMVVTILWRLEGEPASSYDMDYSDVAGGAWDAAAVRWATEHGIVNGSEGQFYPGGIVTREQLAAMLYRYAQYKGYDLTGGDLSGFADAGAVSGWAETSLAWAVSQSLIQGSANQIDPTGSAIRAQLAAILMRFCENLAA